jgi:transcriptional antiterminator RfaH
MTLRREKNAISNSHGSPVPRSMAPPSSDGGLRWYLVHCKPHEDGRALENLERQGFECFRPMRLHERWRNGRKVTASEPLFPRYLFILLDDGRDNWYPIRSTRGVNRIVRFNEKPLPVREEIIDGIRAQLTECRHEPHLRAGQRVRITEGVFSQLEAIFIARDGDERALLLLSILQKEQTLSFPLSSVRRLEI